MTWLSPERRPTITEEELIHALRLKYKELLADELNGHEWILSVRDLLESCFAEDERQRTFQF